MTEDDDMDADTDHTQGPRQRHADQDFNEGLVPRRDFLGVVLAEMTGRCHCRLPPVLAAVRDGLMELEPSSCMVVITG